MATDPLRQPDRDSIPDLFRHPVQASFENEIMRERL
jgi:hypothetical protein